MKRRSFILGGILFVLSMFLASCSSNTEPLRPSDDASTTTSIKEVIPDNTTTTVEESSPEVDVGEDDSKGTSEVSSIKDEEKEIDNGLTKTVEEDNDSSNWQEAIWF